MPITVGGGVIWKSRVNALASREIISWVFEWWPESEVRNMYGEIDRDHAVSNHETRPVSVSGSVEFEAQEVLDQTLCVQVSGYVKPLYTVSIYGVPETMTNEARGWGWRGMGSSEW